MLSNGPHAPRNLRLEYLENPLGIQETRPRFSWWQDDARPGARQVAYQVQVATDPGKLAAGKPDLWDSGKIPSPDVSQVEYAGQALASRQRCSWRVRSFDRSGIASPYSQQ